MEIDFWILPHTLHFKQAAGTSRGIYHTRQSWYILLRDAGNPLYNGIGECAPLPDLSCDALPDYESILTHWCKEFCRIASAYSPENISAIFYDSQLATLRNHYPSMLFGLETALQHLLTKNFTLWNTSFSRGEEGIAINGLIWMGSKTEMLRQIELKMEQGFRCIKLKIGAINFEEELSLIAHIRHHFSPDEIEIRVDANGAFSPGDALEKLKRLAAFGLHSIEQPIRAGQWGVMAQLVATTPLPIALDEELIGVNDFARKQALLDAVRPHYIILKPSLHGGFCGSQEWIAEAEKRNIGWWITSALESNVGLNAIAQWCATLNPPLPQGLGTGALFTDNIELPLVVKGDQLWYNPSGSIPRERFCTDREQQILTVCGIPYTKPLMLVLAAKRLAEAELSEWERDFYTFLLEWWNNSPTLSIHTSGSTGTPKNIVAEKDRMMQSAITTCSALGLQRNDKALLCLPVRYIAGKMMIVRALVSTLDLYPVAPDGNPLAAIPEHLHFDFAAMVPLQVFNSLQNEKIKLGIIKNGIIGGASIGSELEAKVTQLPNAWYSTYGMTETLSHIALRRLNGPEKSETYRPVQNVTISLSPDETLVINAPTICSETICTNDIARILTNGNFEILGRKDNVINSGGVKQYPEQIERKLSNILDFPFCITSVPDPKLGAKVVLLVESTPVPKTELLKKISGYLDSYEEPKHVFYIEKLSLTPNGKIDRKATQHLAETTYTTMLRKR